MLQERSCSSNHTVVALMWTLARVLADEVYIFCMFISQPITLLRRKERYIIRFDLIYGLIKSLAISRAHCQIWSWNLALQKLTMAYVSQQRKWIDLMHARKHKQEEHKDPTPVLQNGWLEKQTWNCKIKFGNQKSETRNRKNLFSHKISLGKGMVLVLVCASASLATHGSVSRMLVARNY